MLFSRNSQASSTAIECAVESQTDIAARNADVDEQQRLRFRIGLHLGDVLVEDGDIFGDGVNIAARLEALAPPGWPVHV